jgi:hypothetical protein
VRQPKDELLTSGQPIGRNGANPVCWGYFRLARLNEAARRRMLRVTQSEWHVRSFGKGCHISKGSATLAGFACHPNSSERALTPSLPYFWAGSGEEQSHTRDSLFSSR